MSDSNKDYSSAFITMLDRDGGEETKAMFYPITQIILNDFSETGINQTRTFTAVDGKWVEVQ